MFIRLDEWRLICQDGSKNSLADTVLVVFPLAKGAIWWKMFVIYRHKTKQKTTIWLLLLPQIIESYADLHYKLYKFSWN